ncbi:MAG TPA: YkgJ family cysteine cluster protein [Methanocella sp.]|nr:YkgJ family cysteine cluster protein [Methanocella sp.]
MQETINDHFECRQCGSCCRSDSMIPLALDDIYRIADFLDMGPDEFFSQYCREMFIGGSTTPMAYLVRDTGCPFLKDNLCSIHFVKPLLCKYMPSTIFGNHQYLKSKLPASCDVQRAKAGWKINDEDTIKERYMVSMILTSIYYSNHGTFRYKSARPYIYRILLINRNRKNLYDVVDQTQMP